MNKILNDVESCSIYTGTYGRKGCTAKCRGCCFAGGLEENRYQGNIEQIHELISILPNLKKVTIFGNPDPTVDPVFCNEVAKVLQSNGIRVSFLTNGTGGTDVVRTIVDELDPSLIFGFGFSVDSLDDKKTSFLKGTNISLQKTLQKMEYLNGLGIRVVTFFLIWPHNMDDNWQEYTDFFESRGIYVSGGFGSVEATNGRAHHIPEEKILEIRRRYKDTRFPTILADDIEYKEYLSTYVTKNSFKCTNLKKINVYLTEKGIKASFSCPIISTVYPEYFVDIRDIGFHTFRDDLIKTGYCPVAKQALGFEYSSTLHPVCRFHKLLPKKLILK